MENVFHFIADHRTTTRILSVVVRFMFLWAVMVAIFLWTPGLLETARRILADAPAVFWGIVVTPGAIMALYTTYAGARYLWLTSEIIYQDLDQ